MDSFLERYKNILVLVAVLVAQIIGLAAQIRRPNTAASDGSSVRLVRYWAISMITPLEKGLHGAGAGIRGLWSNYIDLRHVRRQNQDLRAQVGRLQLEQAALLEDARQGQRLQQLLAFKEHYIYSTVPAQVIGTAGTDQSRILYIDKGFKDGLKPDMPVITPDGIVGKLKDVFPHTSQVLEISDQTSGAGVLLETTRLRGVLRGNALGQPQVINLLPDDRVKPGEHVITSGGDQIFPRGLPVGVVDHVVPDEQNPPFVDVVIKPAANLGRLEEVLIITQTADEMPAKQQKDLAESAAAAAAATTQRAADILAQRLPGLDPAAAPGGATQPNADGSTVALAPPPLKPPPPLHPDHFSPNSSPPAADLIPGKPYVSQVYPPQSDQSAIPAPRKAATEGVTAPVRAETRPATKKSAIGSAGETSPEPAAKRTASPSETPLQKPSTPEHKKVIPSVKPPDTAPEPRAQPPASTTETPQ